MRVKPSPKASWTSETTTIASGSTSPTICFRRVVSVLPHTHIRTGRSLPLQTPRALSSVQPRPRSYMMAFAISSCLPDMMYAMRAVRGPSTTASITRPPMYMATPANRAFRSENTGMDAMTITPSISMLSVPSGMPMRFAMSCATMSVPPVLPPERKTTPTPAPTNTPPQMAEISRSPWVGTGSTGASASITKPDTKMPAMLRVTYDQSRVRSTTYTRSRMFIAMVCMPTGSVTPAALPTA